MEAQTDDWWSSNPSSRGRIACIALLISMMLARSSGAWRRTLRHRVNTAAACSCPAVASSWSRTWTPDGLDLGIKTTQESSAGPAVCHAFVKHFVQFDSILIIGWFLVTGWRRWGILEVFWVGQTILLLFLLIHLGTWRVWCFSVTKYHEYIFQKCACEIEDDSKERMRS